MNNVWPIVVLILVVIMYVVLLHGVILTILYHT